MDITITTYEDVTLRLFTHGPHLFLSVYSDDRDIRSIDISQNLDPLIDALTQWRSTRTKELTIIRTVTEE